VKYSEFPDVNNLLLPKSLRTGKVWEANLASEVIFSFGFESLSSLQSNHAPTAQGVDSRDCEFSAKKYWRFHKEGFPILRTGSPFRLYHNQSETFVWASCDSEKSYRFPTVRPKIYQIFAYKLVQVSDAENKHVISLPEM
jgi:hypothetical protein